jgi:hypothetical protein
MAMQDRSVDVGGPRLFDRADLLQPQLRVLVEGDISVRDRGLSRLT